MSIRISSRFVVTPPMSFATQSGYLKLLNRLARVQYLQIARVDSRELWPSSGNRVYQPTHFARRREFGPYVTRHVTLAGYMVFSSWTWNLVTTMLRKRMIESKVSKCNAMGYLMIQPRMTRNCITNSAIYIPLRTMTLPARFTVSW